MARERPTEPPRVVPDTERGLSRIQRREAEHANLERLKRDSGAGVFGALAASVTRRKRPPAPKFIRRGYEAGILDTLNAFYAQRPRPWRPRANDSCRPTHKELLKARRRAANA